MSATPEYGVGPLRSTEEGARRQVRLASWILAAVLLICGVFGPSATFIVLVAIVGSIDIFRTARKLGLVR